MNSFRLIIRSISFYRRAHLGVLAGIAVATGIIVGALAAGDSVRGSLRDIALRRLGRVESALASNDRFFRAKLADDMAATGCTNIAPVLQFRGIAVNSDSSARAYNVQIIGVDERFWKLGSQTVFGLDGDDAVLNQAVAAKLGLKVGDEFVIRFEKPGALPSDMPLVSDRNSTVAARIRIKAVASNAEFGRFSLRANQAAALNVFVPLQWLGEKAGVAGKANAMLAGGRGQKPEVGQELDKVLGAKLQMTDLALDLRPLSGSNGYELVTSRIFLDPAVGDAALQVATNARGILTYFANEIRAGTNSTPYSFVSAAGAPLVPQDMADDEVILNEWLAKDLRVVKGDTVEMRYFVAHESRTLTETSSVFRVRAVVPIAGATADQNLTPVFPGLSDVSNCRDWDTGIPIDLSKIRGNDEDYWKQYRGLPKAFITLHTAQAMWANRFGSLTAVRYFDAKDPDALAKGVFGGIKPASLGFSFLPVREDALRAAEGGTDFGQLFIGLSMFIVFAALLLTGLLFVFAAEERSEETGLLLGLGFTTGQVRRILLAEGFVIAVLGAGLGVAGGVLYNHAVIRGLTTIWSGAVGMASVQVHAGAMTLATGFISGVVMAVLAMGLVVWRQSLKSVAELQKGGGGGPVGREKRPLKSLLLMALCGALIILIMATSPSGNAVEAFFECGALVLVSAIAFWSIVLILAGWTRNDARPTIMGMGLRNCARRRGRSLATIGLLASGIFIVAAVGANRKASLLDAEQRDSGTGGFAFIGETIMPVANNLNNVQGKQRTGLESEKLAGVGFVQMRVNDGDDASCLNLNRVRKPRILGVQPVELAGKHAFSFEQVIDPAMARSHSEPEAKGWVAKRVEVRDPWLLLNRKESDGAVPAIADATVVTWGLGKKLGDTLDYTDEKNRTFKLKIVGTLAGSVLQGSVLISEQAFVEHFPSIGGYRLFLLDVEKDQRKSVSEYLVRSMQDYGLDLTSAPERLAEFNTVENTYLSIFLALGGLGVILGSIGLGIVVLRNVLERRTELALLRAVGFTRRSLRRMVLFEHGILLAAGLASGAIAAAVAVLPALVTKTADVTLGSVVIVLIGVTVSGLFWTILATLFATRGDLLSALRKE
jgi:putative ABC transport system permease protein